MLAESACQVSEHTDTEKPDKLWETRFPNYEIRHEFELVKPEEINRI